MGRLILGCDLGQKHDPTALVLAEEVQPASVGGRWTLPAGVVDVEPSAVQWLAPAKPEPTYAIRLLERLPLGTAYPAVSERIVTAARNIRALRPGDELYVALDATGVGQPVTDLVRQALRHVDCRVTAVTLTSGDKLAGRLGDAEARCAKSWLVSRLQSLLQTWRISLPSGHPEAEQMCRELLDFEIKISAAGQDIYGAIEKVGAHDDLVVALGLSTLGMYRASGIWTMN